MPAAADAPVRKLAGNGQNIGGTEETPICAKQSSVMTMMGLEMSPDNPIPIAAISRATATCPIRSIVRSECRPSNTMPMPPKIKGKAASNPGLQPFLAHAVAPALQRRAIEHQPMLEELL